MKPDLSASLSLCSVMYCIIVIEDICYTVGISDVCNKAKKETASTPYRYMITKPTAINSP